MTQQDENIDRVAWLNIKSVAEQKKYYFEPYRTTVTVLAVIVVCGIIALVFISYIGATYSSPWALRFIDDFMGNNKTGFATLLQDIVGLFFFACIFGYVYLDLFGGKKFMGNVGEVLGFTYSEIGSMNSVTGALFQIGHDQKISNVLSGAYKGIPMRIYDFEVTRGDGKSAPTYTYSVCEFTFSYQLLHLLLTNHDDEIFGVSTGIIINGGAAFQLEGDFNKYYNVNTENGFENEALRVLTPDIMEKLIEGNNKIMIESQGNKLYLFQKGFVSSRETMMALYERSIRLALILAPRFKDVSKSVGEMESIILDNKHLLT